MTSSTRYHEVLIKLSFESCFPPTWQLLCDHFAAASLQASRSWSSWTVIRRIPKFGCWENGFQDSQRQNVTFRPQILCFDSIFQWVLAFEHLLYIRYLYPFVSYTSKHVKTVPCCGRRQKMLNSVMTARQGMTHFWSSWIWDSGTMEYDGSIG